MSTQIREEEYRVLEVVLREHFANAKREMFVVREQALARSLNFPKSESNESRILHWRTQLRGFSAPAAEDFLEQNQTPGLLERKFNLGLPYILLSESESKEIWQRADNASRRGAPLDGWKVFRQKHPAALGVVSFSRVGINPEKTQALVEAGIQGDWLMGNGHLLLLKRDGSDWTVSSKLFLWIS